MTSLALIIAQHTQSAPDDGLGVGLIVGTIAAVIVAAALIWFVFTRTTRRSRDGRRAQTRRASPRQPARRGDRARRLTTPS
jgi:peptidoglycan/LPS O-acetylase OafA/YrhL